mmetsp:Transcript_8249/g.23260  ORF Transcript_8249/g.23260 Transcript_8249/m.23260 type:complete len:211 (+) Transcript_8249:1259-1891(+)
MRGPKRYRGRETRARVAEGEDRGPQGRGRDGESRRAARARPGRRPRGPRQRGCVSGARPPVDDKQDDGASNAAVHGRLGLGRRRNHAASYGQRGPCAQRLPQHVKEVVQGCYDAWDVSQEAFCTSTYKSGAGVFHSTGLGGVMVARDVRDILASVRFRAEPSGERRRPANPIAGATPTSFPPPAPAPRQGLFSSLFRKSQAPLEDQDLEE